MGIFGNKVVCSNKIAVEACDVFSGAKAKLQTGIDKISINLANRVVLRDSLKEQLAAVELEIVKDRENITTLEVKQKTLDTII